MLHHRPEHPNAARKQRPTALLFLSAALVASACRDYAAITGTGGEVPYGPGSELRAASISVGPRNAEVAVGEQLSFSATVLTANGGVSKAPVTWSVADTALGSLDSSGRLDARRMGVTRIYAAAGNLRDSTDVRVGKRVPAAGGIVSTPDGNARLTVPANALTGDVLVTMLARKEAGSDGALPGTAFDFLPDGVSFAEPAELELHYREGDVDESVARSRLAIHDLTPLGWEPLPTSAVDTASEHRDRPHPALQRLRGRRHGGRWHRSASRPTR